MVHYIVEGCLGSIVGRTDSTDGVMSIVLGQLALSEQAKAKLQRGLANPEANQVQVDYGGSGCTVRVIRTE